MTNNLELVRLLARHGADLNFRRGENNLTMLHMAGRADLPAIVVWLLEKGFDVDVRDNYNRTALHHCAMRGVEVCSCYLMSNGADINAKDLNGNTPLHLTIVYASDEDTLDMFKKLLL